MSLTQVMRVLGTAVTTVLSGSGDLGIRTVFGEVAVVAVLTWTVPLPPAVARGRRGPGPGPAPLRAERGGQRRPRARGLPLRTILTTRSMLVPLLRTTGSYVARNLVASTSGQVRTSFLVTAAGAGQSTATGIGAVVVPLGVIPSLVLVRLVDTRAQRSAHAPRRPRARRARHRPGARASPARPWPAPRRDAAEPREARADA